MFGAANGGTANIKQYDPKTGQVLATIPTDGVHTVIRGAVNPVTGIYYYGDATRIWAYDPNTKLPRPGRHPDRHDDDELDRRHRRQR